VVQLGRLLRFETETLTRPVKKPYGSTLLAPAPVALGAKVSLQSCMDLAGFDPVTQHRKGNRLSLQYRDELTADGVGSTPADHCSRDGILCGPSGDGSR